MVVVREHGDYRIVDDLPQWGGYYSIELRKMYGDLVCWQKVGEHTSKLGEIQEMFNKLIGE